MKTCPKCQKISETPARDFYRSSRRPDGFACWCKDCERLKGQKYRKTEDVFVGDTHKQCTRCRFIQPLSCFPRCSRLKSGLSVYCRKCQAASTAKARARSNGAWTRRQAERVKSRPDLMMKYRILGLVRAAISRQHVRDRPASVTSGFWAAVGYTKRELCDHLERQFLPGMGWHNADKWHIDHIRPVSSFKVTSFSDPDFLECWGLHNLQPLWAIDNLRKGARYDPT